MPFPAVSPYGSVVARRGKRSIGTRRGGFGTLRPVSRRVSPAGEPPGLAGRWARACPGSRVRAQRLARGRRPRPWYRRGSSPTTALTPAPLPGGEGSRRPLLGLACGGCGCLTPAPGMDGPHRASGGRARGPGGRPGGIGGPPKPVGRAAVRRVPGRALTFWARGGKLRGSFAVRSARGRGPRLNRARQDRFRTGCDDVGRPARAGGPVTAERSSFRVRDHQ